MILSSKKKNVRIVNNLVIWGGLLMDWGGLFLDVDEIVSIKTYLIKWQM